MTRLVEVKNWTIKALNRRVVAEVWRDAVVEPDKCTHRVSPIVDTFTSDRRFEISVIRSVYVDGWRVIEFAHPIRQCADCGRLFAYPIDPRSYPQTDDGDPAELEHCEP